MSEKQKRKVGKFLLCVNLVLAAITFSTTALLFSSTYLNYVTHQSNASPQYIENAKANHKFIKEEIFPHSYEKELNNIKIYVRSVNSINYPALALLYANKNVYNLMDRVKGRKSVEAIEQYTYDYADKIKGDANSYLYNVYKQSGESTADTPSIYLSADNSVVKRFQEQVFDGHQQLALDMIFFHEFTHHLQRTIVAQLNAKAVLTVEDFKEELTAQNVNMKDYSPESLKVLNTLFQESVADSMALQLLEAKYPALNIEYLADNLAIFRNTADLAHFTSLALMPLENSNAKSKTFIQMYEIAQKHALHNLKTLLLKGVETVHAHVEKLSTNRVTSGLYKAQYNQNIKERYLDITLNYNSEVQRLGLDKLFIEDIATGKFRTSRAYRVKNH